MLVQTLIQLQYNAYVNLSIYGWDYVHKNASQTIFFSTSTCKHAIQFHREINQKVKLGGGGIRFLGQKFLNI